LSADGLVVIHIDGLGFDVLQRALQRGDMPFTRGLLNNGYSVQPYRCGLPSTTPYCQAGILYGDNRNIPGFRWYDKQAGVAVGFGVDTSFKKVAHRYFQGRVGLATGGAAIAACYPGGADQTFGLAFKQRQHGIGRDNATHLIGRFLANPRHLADMLGHAGYTAFATASEFIEQRLRRQHPAVAYAATDILEELLVHDLTRYAAEQAMSYGLPVIYAGFYAYDEAAHGFGPEDSVSLRILRHVDRTLQLLFSARDKLRRGGRAYQVVVLSDHGQSKARSFESVQGKPLAQLLSEWLPRMQVGDLKGKSFGPQGDALDGHLAIAGSGGLANLYLKELAGRLSLDQVEQACPGLVAQLAAHPLVHFILVRGRDGEDLVVTGQDEKPLEAAADLLAVFDDPQILIRQLGKLNSFETAGDVMVVGRWNGVEQINFEKQMGGHGSLGGEQNHPFLLGRSELGLKVDGVTDASELQGMLRELVPSR
jgi:hypothetical protein